MILLDTCTLLWLAMDQTRLSTRAKALLRDNAGALFVSVVSAFEIAQKHAGKKLELPTPPQAWFPRALELHGLNLLPLRAEPTFIAAGLPLLHKDPFDRLLIGCALHEKLLLLTPDPLIRQYGQVRTDW